MTEEALWAAIQQARERFELPGVLVAVARSHSEPRVLVAGADAHGAPLSENSLVPVASITKLAVALCVLRLVEASRLDLDDPLERFAPEAAAARPGVTVRLLLSHTAGLPDDVRPEDAPYRPGLDWNTLAAACVKTPPDEEPGLRVRYSNLGPGLLAVVIERLTGYVFSRVLQEQVFGPLGIEAYFGAEPPRSPAAIADVRSEHAGTDLEPYNSAFWRSLALPWGGMITTVQGCVALVRAFHDDPRGFLSDALCTEATRNQARGLAGGFFKPLLWEPCPWGLGVELRGSKSPHWAPVEASPASFGHAGASGCLAWLDPEADTAWAIAGLRTIDNGWLVQAGPAIGSAILGKGAAESKVQSSRSKVSRRTTTARYFRMLRYASSRVGSRRSSVSMLSVPTTSTTRSRRSPSGLTWTVRRCSRPSLPASTRCTPGTRPTSSSSPSRGFFTVTSMTRMPLNLRLISAGLPWATIRPRWMMAMRSQMASASNM